MEVIDSKTGMSPGWYTDDGKLRSIEQFMIHHGFVDVWTDENGVEQTDGWDEQQLAHMVQVTTEWINLILKEDPIRMKCITSRCNIMQSCDADTECKYKSTKAYLQHMYEVGAYMKQNGYDESDLEHLPCENDPDCFYCGNPKKYCTCF